MEYFFEKKKICRINDVPSSSSNTLVHNAQTATATVVLKEY